MGLGYGVFQHHKTRAIILQSLVILYHKMINYQDEQHTRKQAGQYVLNIINNIVISYVN